MKYLLGFLETLDDGPDLSDAGFQQLLVDVQAGKTQAKSADAFYESLEKIVNELRVTPESAAFQKPVSKREAPDYYEVVKRPMDLFTVSRNIKAHKYKNKAEFAADLDLIWENCFHYNTQETHPLRAAARFMKQKADHHLEFLADKNGKSSHPILPPLSAVGDGPIKRQLGVGGSIHTPVHPSPLGRAASLVPYGEGVTAGESDDDGMKATQKDGESSRPRAAEGSRPRSASRGRRGTSVSAIDRPINGKARRHSQVTRPKLQTNLDVAPALIRTPYTMTHYLPISLNDPGPSFSEKGKAKEILHNIPPPSWYSVLGAEEDESKLEGSWWTAFSKDDAYVSGLPPITQIISSSPVPRSRIPGRRHRISQPNGSSNRPHADRPPGFPETVVLKKAVHRAVDKLNEGRRIMHQIGEWQRIEAEGGMLPPAILDDPDLKDRHKGDALDLRRRREEEKGHAVKRRKFGGEIGEKEAAMALKKAAASMLAHAGFEGANEIALDMFTRVAADHLRNVGRTFRLLLDGFGHKMPPDEIVLHALHENGQAHSADIETHVKDDIERDGAKIAEMTRRIRQAFKEVTTAPVIEDEMMFNENGEMLLDGNFAEQLGEDFLGLRDMGIDQEHGLSSLTVPASVFYGRRKRTAYATDTDVKAEIPDYPPPPPFIPLSQQTLHHHLPALLHSFYAARIESGLGLAGDDPFDPMHSQIGSLGQVVVRNPVAAKKKRDKVEEGEKKVMKKIPGPGKGNWIRPSKEERQALAAKKVGMKASSPIVSDGAGGDEEDAEGEEE